MISIEDRESLHEFIILELAIRSLQRDFVKLEALEALTLHKFYVEWTTQALNQLYPPYYEQKQQLKKKHIRIIKWEKIDEYFSDVWITTQGEDQALRYASNALKTEVETFLLNNLPLQSSKVTYADFKHH